MRLPRRRFLGLAAATSLAACTPESAADDPDAPPDMTGLVNPFIGTGSPGNTFPGAKIPFGFAAPSPNSHQPLTSGYNPDTGIIGFAQTHVSGTGGDSRYGNFRITPITGPMRSTDLISPATDERASPGYYAVYLERPTLLAELTATRRCAVHRYTFDGRDTGHLVFDVTSVIEVGEAQTPEAAEVRIVGDNRIEGMVRVTGGWGNPGGHYTLYFAAQVDRKFIAHAVFHGGELVMDAREGKSGWGERMGAVVSIKTALPRPIEIRVGLSFRSIEAAWANIRTELAEHPFDRIRRQAVAKWRDVLGKVIVEGGTEAQRRIFYTGLYHSHLMPHDLSGENVWWESDAPHYEDFYTLWDTVHGVHPLLTLIQPKRQADMVQSLVETYRYTGWMPDARIAGVNCFIQGGTTGDVLVADALGKGLPGVDYVAAYAALRKNGETRSPKPLVEGRDLQHYLRRGYLSADGTESDGYHGGRSASRTLEYSFQDFCIASVAESFDDTDIARAYRHRAKNWAFLWDANTQSIRPRHSNGRFVQKFDPANTDTEYFYEGSAYQYTTVVPHDVQGLINGFGGDRPFYDWLELLFHRNRYTAGNEHDFHAPYLYTHVGRPDRTVDRLRALLTIQYTESRNGLPGNDDAGAMSAWYVWSAIGLYPRPGQGWYYLTSPIFERTTLQLGDGKKLRIDAPGASESRRYVQRARLNGESLDRAWIHHRDIRDGAIIELELGTAPSEWGQQDRPPSMSAAS